MKKLISILSAVLFAVTLLVVPASAQVMPDDTTTMAPAKSKVKKVKKSKKSKKTKKGKKSKKSKKAPSTSM